MIKEAALHSRPQGVCRSGKEKAPLRAATGRGVQTLEIRVDPGLRVNLYFSLKPVCIANETNGRIGVSEAVEFGREKPIEEVSNFDQTPRE
jgi:hypothetical protein